jgi:hypothetical protein
LSPFEINLGYGIVSEKFLKESSSSDTPSDDCIFSLSVAMLGGKCQSNVSFMAIFPRSARGILSRHLSMHFWVKMRR